MLTHTKELARALAREIEGFRELHSLSGRVQVEARFEPSKGFRWVATYVEEGSEATGRMRLVGRVSPDPVSALEALQETSPRVFRGGVKLPH